MTQAPKRGMSPILQLFARMAVRRAIANLVDNALRYAGENSIGVYLAFFLVAALGASALVFLAQPDSLIVTREFADLHGPIGCIVLVPAVLVFLCGSLVLAVVFGTAVAFVATYTRSRSIPASASERDCFISNGRMAPVSTTGTCGASSSS